MATILVVDDEKENCDLFSEVLSAEGNYQVESAYNGQQALDMAQKKRYDVIISDITMPKLDGLTFLKEVKRRNADVEVIMVSGAGTIDSAIDAFKSQAFDFLTKPLEIDRLLSTVKSALLKADLSKMVAELATTLPYQDSAGDLDLLLGHLVVSSDLTVVSASQRLVEFLGGPSSSPKGVNLSSFPPFKFLVPALQQSIAERSDCLRRWEVLGLKEHLRILSFSTRYVPDLPSGPGALAVVEDITRIRRQERERRDRERLSAIGEMTTAVTMQVEALLGGIAQNLDIVVGEVQTLNSRRPNVSTIIGHTETSCQTVKGAIAKIANLLSTLKEFSRQFVSQYSPIDVNDVLQRAANQTEIPEGVEVNFDLADDLRPVMGNLKDLTQVVVNLITNAVQGVHAKGSITISSRASASGVVSIEVTDDGEGIAVENLDRIFEPFFTTRGDKGKGLGLALARKVIDDHDGVINVVSQPGKGSTFMITLPVKPS